MPLEVHAVNNSIIVHNGRNRISVTEEDLDNCYAIHVYWGVLEMDDDPVYVLEDPQEAGDIINGAKIRPKPRMVVKNMATGEIFQYMYWHSLNNETAIYCWAKPGTRNSLTGLDDNNYKILDSGE